VRDAVGVRRYPVEDHRADARAHVGNLGFERSKSRVADVSVTVEMCDEQPRVGAGCDPEQSQLVRAVKPASRARYSATVALATPIASACSATRTPASSSMT
jgi:hypothetical protein